MAFTTTKLNGNILTINNVNYKLMATVSQSYESKMTGFNVISCVDNGDGTIALKFNNYILTCHKHSAEPINILKSCDGTLYTTQGVGITDILLTMEV